MMAIITLWDICDLLDERILGSSLKVFHFLQNLHGSKSGNNIKFPSLEQFSTQLLKRVSSILNFSCAISSFPLPFSTFLKYRSTLTKKIHVYIKKVVAALKRFTQDRDCVNLLVRPSKQWKKWASSSRVRKFKLKRRQRINISFTIHVVM